MSASDSSLGFPPDITLPMFVYGALKPNMPAYECLREYVDGQPERDTVAGELYVRDGLPLLFLNNRENIFGYTLKWIPAQEEAAYRIICNFEPEKHYSWSKVKTASGILVNVLQVRYQNKGNPQPLEAAVWRLSDDPAFGVGLSIVRAAEKELNSWDGWERFFRAQMAYLLLWSILERLSALCFGSTLDPTKRVGRLHELAGIADFVRNNVKRIDSVSDSRNPDNTYKLDVTNPKKCFQYYYQVRSNLCHRGKAVYNEVEKVQSSLDELLNITEQYLMMLKEREVQS